MLDQAALRKFGTISLQMATQVSHYDKKSWTIKIGMAIINEDDASHKQAENFLKLYESSWSAEISAPITKHQWLMQLNKSQETPLDSDISKLVEFMDNEITSLIKQPSTGDDCTG